MTCALRVLSLAGAACVVALGGCDVEISQERVRDKASKEIARMDEFNREWEASRQRDVDRVKRYQRWFERLRAIDHAALGLPEPAFGPDGASRPATASITFCSRLVAMPVRKPALTPEQWVAEYRDQVARFVAALHPDDYESYRAHYLAERQLARLACTARDSGPALRQALLGLLTEAESGDRARDQARLEADPTARPYASTKVGDAVRYTAAVYAIKHQIDSDLGQRTLRHMQSIDSFFQYRAKANLDADRSSLTLGFDPTGDYFMKKALLHNERKPRRMRSGNVRSGRPPSR